MNKSCIHLCIEEVGKCFNIDTNLLAFQIFGIDYCNKLNSEAIYKKFRPGQIVHFTEFCKNMYGLNFYQCNNFWDYKEKIEYGIKNQYKMMIGFDNFYLPWGNTFNKTHVIHYFNISGIDKDGRILCNDKYNKKYNEELSDELFSKGYKIGYFISRGNIISNNKMIESILKDFNIYNNNLAYKMLIKELLNVKSYDEIFESSDANACEMIIFSKIIIQYEEMKIKLLETYKKSQIKLLIKSILNVIDKWKSILQLLIYMLYSCRIRMEIIEKITKLLAEICYEQQFQYNFMCKVKDSI